MRLPINRQGPPRRSQACATRKTGLMDWRHTINFSQHQPELMPTNGSGSFPTEHGRKGIQHFYDISLYLTKFHRFSFQCYLEIRCGKPPSLSSLSLMSFSFLSLGPDSESTWALKRRKNKHGVGRKCEPKLRFLFLFRQGE